MQTILDAALWYCRAGFAIFPLAPGTKIPMKGSRGFLDATTDEKVIREWWTANPTANIGLATAGLCVIDFDMDKSTGQIAAWLREQGPAEAVKASPMRQRTPSGGLHVLFKQPQGAAWSISASMLAHCVDVRANGGYIVAAPSVVDDCDYEWQEGPVAAADLPEPPSWLAERIAALSTGGPKPQGNIQGAFEDFQSEKIGLGSRHQALLSWAGLFRSWGMDGFEIEAALSGINANRCEPPSPDKEVRRIARDYAKKAIEESKARAAGKDGEFALPSLEARLAVVPGSVEVDDPGPVPAELLLQVPGFVHDVIQYSLDSAPFPNPVLAWAGAMCLQSFLCARKVHFEGIAPNIYILGLALSGGGKEQPRKVNAEIMTTLGLHKNLGDRFASAEGIEDALTESPALLFQTDEIDGMLEASAQSKDQRFRGVRDMILSLYGESSGVHVGRRKAGGSEPAVVFKPSLTLFGTAIPEHCYGVMTEEMVTKGLLSRMLILDSVRGERQPFKSVKLDPSIIERGAWWRDFNPAGGNLAALVGNPSPIPVAVDEGACVVLSAEEQRQDELYRAAQAKGDNVQCGMTSRVMLQARKLALLWACSEWLAKGAPASGTRPVVTLEAARWGIDIVSWLAKRTMAMFARNSKTTLDFERRADKFVAYVTRCGGAASHRDVANYLKLPKRELDSLVDTMTDRGKIEIVSKADGRGRPGKVYVLPNYAYSASNFASSQNQAQVAPE